MDISFLWWFTRSSMIKTLNKLLHLSSNLNVVFRTIELHNWLIQYSKFFIAPASYRVKVWTYIVNIKFYGWLSLILELLYCVSSSFFLFLIIHYKFIILYNRHYCHFLYKIRNSYLVVQSHDISLHDLFFLFFKLHFI